MSDTTPTTTSITVAMDKPTQRFYQGVATGSKIRDAHDPVHDLAGSDHETRARMFWFYAGAVAVAEHGVDIENDEELTPFLQGLGTRAPQPLTDDDED